jgi:MFS family permease
MASINSPGAPSLTPQPAASSKRLLPWLVAVAFFMESLDTTILNTAVPTISAALHVTPLSMKSVLASYTLSLAVFIPISGWMADRFGTRRVFASAIGLFTLGSLLCGVSTNIHLLVACRILQGCGGAMMVPVGRLTLVRTFAKSELIRAMSFVAIPGLVGPMLGPVAGGLIVGYFHWRLIFFVNIPIGIFGLLMVYLHLPDYREEHTSLLGGYLLHARGTAFPLLQLNLFRIRTFSAAVSGSFFTRLGIGGVPFLLPLLYQVGLGFSAIESGLLIAPQAIAAMSTKFLMPKILARIGFRGVLMSNTVILGVLLLLFATIGLGTPVWLIVLQAFCYGTFSSLQYTSMNTLAYADVSEDQTSNASSIASTMQQMSISFGVASAGLATAFFIPASHANQRQMIHGIHQALVMLGGFTILSTIIFRKLKSGDGSSVSQQKAAHSE